MNEKEPIYVKKIIDHIDRKIDETNFSIKELETMMIDGFSQVHKRLDNHDEKFEQIDAKFEQIDARFEQIDARFEQTDDRFDRIDSAIYDIKADIRKIEGHIGRYKIRAQNIEQILLQDHKPRIAELERIAFA